MQDWDRWALIGVAALTGIYAGIDGYRAWRKRKYLGAVGIGLLIIIAMAVPLVLALKG